MITASSIAHLSEPCFWRTDYFPKAQLPKLLADATVMAILTFDQRPELHHDPRIFSVPLHQEGPPMVEVWRTQRPVQSGHYGNIRWASNGMLSFGAIAYVEQDLSLETSSACLYHQLATFLENSATPCLLRIWNYLDGINLGQSDQERYRQFCVGRVQGWTDIHTKQLAAASAIGRTDGQRIIHVYWLAANHSGLGVENPRQISAYRYPRQYGPQAPSFVRAMLSPTVKGLPLLLSGTASVRGHQSVHPHQLAQQLDETLLNFRALIDTARAIRPDLPPWFDQSTRLRIYVRHRHDIPKLIELLSNRLGKVPMMFVQGDVCRRDLLLEMDGVHGQSASLP